MLDENRKHRKALRKTRRDLGRGRALYDVAHPEGNWFGLEREEQKKWILAFHKGQDAATASPEGSHLLVAIAIGQGLGIIKGIMHTLRLGPEEQFVQLDTATQRWLWLTALRAQWIFKSNTTAPITTVIEIRGAAGPEVAEAMFNAAQEAAAALEEQRPGRWEATISQSR